MIEVNNYSNLKIFSVKDLWAHIFVYIVGFQYIVSFRLVEAAVLTNQKLTIYHNLYENMDSGLLYIY